MLPQIFMNFRQSFTGGGCWWCRDRWNRQHHWCRAAKTEMGNPCSLNGHVQCVFVWWLCEWGRSCECSSATRVDCLTQLTGVTSTKRWTHLKSYIKFIFVGAVQSKTQTLVYVKYLAKKRHFCRVGMREVHISVFFFHFGIFWYFCKHLIQFRSQQYEEH